MMNAQYYYQVLGVSENATISEIKRAFRRKAKLYHPDINRGESSHDQFINVNEAYSFLIDLHTQTEGKTQTGPDREEYYNFWVEKERHKARREASRRAKMNFNKFKNSPEYRTTSILSCIIDFFIFFLGLFMILAAVAGIYRQGIYIEEDGHEVLNLTGITTVVVITVAGIFFMIISYSSIQNFRRS